MSRLSSYCLALLLSTLLLGSCTTRRVMAIETRLLRQENAELQQRLHELEQRMPAAGTYVRHLDLGTVHEFLERAGYAHIFSPGADEVRMDFSGKNTVFGVTVRHFDSAAVLYLATDDYLHLSAASNTESVVLLLVQLASLNYEMLVGKFQLNAETGEILLSVEISTIDGLGYDTFVNALEQLLHTADSRYPELERAAAGLGL
jgi:hypothetical protein